MLNHIGIGKRLNAAFLLATLITLLTGLIGIYFVGVVGQTGLYVGESAAPLVDAVMESKLLATEAHLKFEEIMGGDTAESIETVQQLMDKSAWFLTAIAEGGENAEGRFIPVENPATRAQVGVSQQKLRALRTSLEKRYATLDQHVTDEIFHQLDAQFDGDFDGFIEEIDKLETAIQSDVKNSLQHLHDTIDESKLVFAVLIAVALGFALLLGQVTTRSITQPLGQCVQIARHIQSGDLTIQARPTGCDEIAQLLQTLDSMRQRLLTIISVIVNNVATLNRSAESLASTSMQSEHASVVEAESSEMMASAIEQFSVSIDQIGQQAKTVHKVAEQSGNLSLTSGNIIQETAEEMGRVAAAVKSTALTIQELEDFSGQIYGIVNIISGIADQTNLLALNAAIEAARAGEQGRGFAVVADEVRELAKRTASSTQEITGMIGKIQINTQKAAQEIESGVSRVNDGVALANKAADSIADIRHSSQQVSTAIGDITRILSEQSTAIREMAQRIKLIAESAAENCHAATDTSHSAHDMANLAQNLEKTVSDFKIV